MVQSPCNAVHCNRTRCCAAKRAQRPVLGGVDLVATRALPNDETAFGRPEFRRSFGHFLFYFLNERNAVKFEKHPVRFLPAYGGFCSYGIAYEPQWISAVNLGPDTELSKTQLIKWIGPDERLFLFGGANVRDTFVANATASISSGDARWSNILESDSSSSSSSSTSGLISSPERSIYNTNCIHYAEDTGPPPGFQFLPLDDIYKNVSSVTNVSAHDRQTDPFCMF